MDCMKVVGFVVGWYGVVDYFWEIVGCLDWNVLGIVF